VLIVAAGHNNTVYLAPILIVGSAYVVWRKYRRRGQLVRGAEIAPRLTRPLGGSWQVRRVL
jgi:hypothetical protein